jgi:hypothetical protein
MPQLGGSRAVERMQQPLVRSVATSITARLAQVRMLPAALVSVLQQLLVIGLMTCPGHATRHLEPWKQIQTTLSGVHLA